MELEGELRGDVCVRLLLEGERDVETNRLAAGFLSAPVGGFHDARPAAGSDDEVMARLAVFVGPFC